MEETATTQATCPYCKNPTEITMFFCPSCGKKLKEKPPGTGFWPQAGLYAMAVMLPPFNIPLSFKYIKSTDSKAKAIGFVSLVLMGISLTVVTILTINTVNEVNRQVEAGMGQYLGF